MKVTNQVTSRNVVLGSALLGICTTIGLTNPAQAAPRDDNARQYRQDDRDDQDNATRDEKNGKPGARKGQRGGRDGNRGARDQQQDVRYNRDDQQRDNHQGDDRQHGRGGGRGHGHDDGDDGNRGRQNGGYDFSNRGGNNSNRPDSRPADNRGPLNDGFETNGGRSYTGTVTRVRSATNFDVNINGNTSNVYLDVPAPRGLVKGDSVRITGVQQDKNDIRNASVSLLRNR